MIQFLKGPIIPCLETGVPQKRARQRNCLSVQAGTDVSYGTTCMDLGKKRSKFFIQGSHKVSGTRRPTWSVQHKNQSGFPDFLRGHGSGLK